MRIDVEEVTSIIGKMPFRVFNQSSLEMYDTIPINENNTYAEDISKWDGKYIETKITSIPPQVVQVFYVKIANFSEVDIATTFPKYHLSFDLQGLYHFSNGSAVDSSGNMAHGTLHETWACADRDSEPYQAVEFDGDTSWVEIPMTVFGNTTTDYTISFWLLDRNPSTNVEHPRHICYFNNSLRFLFTPANNGSSIKVVNIGHGNAELVGNLEASRWNHVVYVQRSGDGTYLYINGELAVSDNGYDNRNSASYMWFGRGQTTDASEKEYFRGRMDELRFYNRPLTTEEIEALYTIYDRNKLDIQMTNDITTNIHYPASRITSLVDIKSLQGTPLVIYKYFNIPETVIEYIT